jgi:hypothetical protein
VSERQAKRLRRARRAYIRANKTSLAKGAPVHQAADARANIVRELWPRLNHRGRGVVGRHLGPWCGHSHLQRPCAAHDLDGALRALGVAVPA